MTANSHADLAPLGHYHTEAPHIRHKKAGGRKGREGGKEERVKGKRESERTLIIMIIKKTKMITAKMIMTSGTITKETLTEKEDWKRKTIVNIIKVIIRG